MMNTGLMEKLMKDMEMKNFLQYIKDFHAINHV